MTTARRGLRIGVGALVTTALLVVNGELPFLVSSTQAWYTAVGYMECGALSLRALARSTCPLVGGQVGGSQSNGALFTDLGAIVVRVGVSPGMAYSLVAAVFMAIAVWGVVALARRVGVVWWIGMIVAFAYLASSSLLGLHDFGSTFWGAAIIPAAVEVALLSSAGLSRAGARRGWFWALGWTGSALAMLLMDGYSYVMAQLAVGVVLLALALRHPRRLASWLPLGWMAVANVVAFAAYRVLVPGSAGWESSPIDLFRSMGADLATLGVPSGSQWWSSISPVTVDPSLLWGDGSNSTSNYLGWLVVGLAVVGAVLARRRALVVPLLVIAAVALFLSLGPSLKIDAVRGPLAVPVTRESYLMPASSATMDLPTAWLYAHVPGLDMMRASYRWIVLGRLALLIVAAVGVQELWRRRRSTLTTVAVAALGVAAVLEVSPDVVAVIRANAHGAEMTRQFDAQVLDPMKTAITPRTTVVFAPNAVSENDFLANYLAPMLEVTTYNVGGDKTLAEAAPKWPEDVKALLFSRLPFAEAAEQVLRSGDAKAVVIPYFDLRWSASQWPTSQQFIQPGKDAAAEAAANPALVVATYDHFAVVTLAP